MKKQKKKKKKNNRINNKKRKQIIKLLLILGAITILTIGILTYAELGGFEKAKEKETITIQDECQQVAGNILHSFNDEGGCKLRCLNECEIREKTYITSELTLANQEQPCHSCNCTCL